MISSQEQEGTILLSNLFASRSFFFQKRRQECENTRLYASLLDLIVPILLIASILIIISTNISFSIAPSWSASSSSSSSSSGRKCTCSPPSQCSPWSWPCAPACTQSPALWQQIKDQQKSQKVRKINSMNNWQHEHWTCWHETWTIPKREGLCPRLIGRHGISLHWDDRTWVVDMKFVKKFHAKFYTLKACKVWLFFCYEFTEFTLTVSLQN